MDNNISVKLISLEDIKKTRSFDLKKIIEIIENSLIAYSKGEILLPDKISQIFDYKLQTRINCHLPKGNPQLSGRSFHDG